MDEDLITQLLIKLKPYLRHNDKCLRQPWHEGSSECSCELEKMIKEIETYTQKGLDG